MMVILMGRLFACGRSCPLLKLMRKEVESGMWKQDENKLSKG